MTTVKLSGALRLLKGGQLGMFRPVIGGAAVHVGELVRAHDEHRQPKALSRVELARLEDERERHIRLAHDRLGGIARRHLPGAELRGQAALGAREHTAGTDDVWYAAHVNQQDAHAAAHRLNAAVDRLDEERVRAGDRGEDPSPAHYRAVREAASHAVRVLDGGVEVRRHDLTGHEHAIPAIQREQTIARARQLGPEWDRSMSRGADRAKVVARPGEPPLLKYPAGDVPHVQRLLDSAAEHASDERVGRSLRTIRGKVASRTTP